MSRSQPRVSASFQPRSSPATMCFPCFAPLLLCAERGWFGQALEQIFGEALSQLPRHRLYETTSEPEGFLVLQEPGKKLALCTGNLGGASFVEATPVLWISRDINRKTPKKTHIDNLFLRVRSDKSTIGWPYVKLLAPTSGPATGVCFDHSAGGKALLQRCYRRLLRSCARRRSWHHFNRCSTCWCSAGNEGMTPINHPLWFPLRESPGSFLHSLLSTSTSLQVGLLF